MKDFVDYYLYFDSVLEAVSDAGGQLNKGKRIGRTKNLGG